jgi:hypothetical protein
MYANTSALKSIFYTVLLNMFLHIFKMREKDIVTSEKNRRLFGPLIIFSYEET